MAEIVRISRAKREEARNKKQRSKHMFNNEILSDVKFVVRASQHGENDSKRGKIVIPAHKVLLSISSPVFFSMFCGEMAETRQEIDLPDCEYEGMLELLRYIYTDEVCLNGTNVMQVLYVAEKYMIPCLAKECIKYLITNLDPSNVFCVLKHAQQYEQKDLLRQCWYLIDKKTEEVFKSSEFVTIEIYLLEQLVLRDTLDIKEVELFKAVDCWAEKECERQNLQADGSVKRRILGEQIVNNIRFPAMKKSDFMETVFDSKMFITQEEASNIMKYFSSNLTSPVGFQVAERGSCLRCCTSEAAAGTCHMKNNPDRPCYLEVTVDKDIMLYGVAMFAGNKYIDDCYSVTLQALNNDDSVVAAKSGTFLPFQVESEADHPSYYGFDVLFEAPVTLRKDVQYCFEASIDGPTSICEGRFVNDIRCAGVSFNFKQPGVSEEEVEFLLPGQIAEVLFKVK